MTINNVVYDFVGRLYMKFVLFRSFDSRMTQYICHLCDHHTRSMFRHDNYIVSSDVRLCFMRNCDKIQYRRYRVDDDESTNRKKSDGKRDGGEGEVCIEKTNE